MSKYLVLAICLLLLAISAHAQYELKLQQSVFADTRTWVLEVFSDSGKPVQYFMKIQASHSKNGQVLELSTKSFEVTSYATIQWMDLIKQYPHQYLELHPEFEEAFYGNELLQSGEYSICLLLLKEEKPIAENCQNFLVDETEIAPPLLIVPANGDTVDQLPVFTWYPPAPTPKEVKHDLFIYDIEEGQTPQTAVSKNQPFFIHEGIVESIYIYSPVDKAFMDQHSYAWQIISYTPDLVLPSNIEHFVIGKTNMNPTEDEKELTDIAYFELSKTLSTEFFYLEKQIIHFIYVNENTSRDIKYEITDERGISLLEGELSADYGINFFSIDLANADMDENTFGQLVIEKDNVQQQYLNFLFTTNQQ